MADTTDRFSLNTYAQGDDAWDHTDTVQQLDELGVDSGTVSERPASGTYDNELFYATDHLTLYQWDQSNTEWDAVGGLGTDSNPLPQLYAQTVSAAEEVSANGTSYVGTFATVNDLPDPTNYEVGDEATVESDPNGETNKYTLVDE
jgi:hypothetical protein